MELADVDWIAAQQSPGGFGGSIHQVILLVQLFDIGYTQLIGLWPVAGATGNSVEMYMLPISEFDFTNSKHEFVNRSCLLGHSGSTISTNCSFCASMLARIQFYLWNANH